MINSTNCVREIVEATQINEMQDKVPTQLSNSVSPVIEANPHLARPCNIVRSQANLVINSNATIYTVPTTAEFYLCGWTISMYNDVASTASYATILYTGEDGNTVNLTRLYNTVGLINMQNATMTYGGHPIRIPKGSVITVTIAGVAAGAANAHACIFGYLEHR